MGDITLKFRMACEWIWRERGGRDPEGWR